MFFKKKDIETEDQSLIENFRATGDLEVLSILYSRYIHLVYGVCLKYLNDREESKDTVMQIFEKLSVELNRHSPENFKSWLHVLTKNFSLMKLRSDKSRQKREDDTKKDLTVFMESTYEMHHENGVPLNEDIDALRSCIEKLASDQKICVSMFYLEEKCYKEISDTLGYEVKKVKSYIQNGKRNLKICLEKRNG